MCQINVHSNYSIIYMRQTLFGFWLNLIHEMCTYVPVWYVLLPHEYAHIPMRFNGRRAQFFFFIFSKYVRSRWKNFISSSRFVILHCWHLCNVHTYNFMVCRFFCQIVQAVDVNAEKPLGWLASMHSHLWICSFYEQCWFFFTFFLFFWNWFIVCRS